jgi:hypothetical protein
MIVALLAAYAVALQALLLAAAAPVAGAMEITGDPAALPICSGVGAGHSMPVNHDHGCLGACLAGCCGSAPAAPHSVAVVLVAPSAEYAVTPVLQSVTVPPFRAAGAHRSRAPPIA